MFRIVIVVALCGHIVIPVSAQRQPVRRIADVRISKKHPTVYLKFERVGKREPRKNGESNEGVWLRLYNNTRWKIHIQAYGLDGLAFLRGNEKEVGLYYEVGLVPKPSTRFVEVDGPPAPEKPLCEAPLLRYGDLRSGVELQPTESIVFSVAREHLCENLYVTVKFRYEWESYGDEPEHRVRFYGFDVPDAP